MTDKRAELYARITTEYANVAASYERITRAYLDIADLNRSEEKPIRRFSWKGFV